MSNQEETVLITGASTGIGRAVAGAFLDQGFNLVLNSRDPCRLEAAYEALGRPDNAVVSSISAKACRTASRSRSFWIASACPATLPSDSICPKEK